MGNCRQKKLRVLSDERISTDGKEQPKKTCLSVNTMVKEDVDLDLGENRIFLLSGPG